MKNSRFSNNYCMLIELFEYEIQFNPILIILD